MTIAKMCIKFILLIFAISSCLVHCEQKGDKTGFSILQSLNSNVSEIRFEQKLMLQQLQADREFMLNISTDLQKLLAEQLQIREDQRLLIDLVNQQLTDKMKQCDTQHSLDNISFERNCAERNPLNKSEIYVLLPRYSEHPFKVACDMATQGGGWTIILRRQDGSVDFYRKWAEYKEGFGSLSGEFFLGLDRIHALTSDRRMELLVILEDHEGDIRYANYDQFAIGNEAQSYRLNALGIYNGTAGDSMAMHRDMQFTTSDRDNDKHPSLNCAKVRSGAWWYNSCHESHLTGKFGDNTNSDGINWYHFRGFEYSLKRAVMMIRPTK